MKNDAPLRKPAAAVFVLYRTFGGAPNTPPQWHGTFARVS
jgi:hypothetical protein